MSEKLTSIQQGLARTLLADEDFIASARKACANSIRYSATEAYLDEALQRLEQAHALIDKIKVQVGCGGVKHVGRIYSMIKEWEQK